MENLVMFLLAFLLVYLIYLVLVVFNKKGRKKLKTGIEAKFLIKIYNVRVDKIDDKKFANTIALVNSLIVSIVFVVIDLFFKSAILQILLAFPILILLIILFYSILGKCYKRKYV